MCALLMSDSGGGTGVLTPPRPQSPRRQHDHGSGDGLVPPDDGDGDGGGGGGGGDGDPEPPDDGSSRSNRASREGMVELGMELGLVSIASLFLVFLGFYIYLRSPDWATAAGPPQGLWISTVVLILSSTSLAYAVRASAHCEAQRALHLVLATLVLGLLFLAVQLGIWISFPEQAAEGYRTAFYLLTCLHAVHVLCGLAYLAALYARMLRAEPRGSGQTNELCLCARYWHFIGAIWLILFAVLYTQI